MAWTHPTGGKPKTVNLIGLGPSHHDYDQGWLAPHTPDVLWRSDEIWTINRGGFSIVHDLLFVMDWIENEAKRFPTYGAKLHNHDRPIITSVKPQWWPAHTHEYPFDEIWTWLQTTLKKPPVHCDWWHNSVPFIIAYAAFIGVERLYCWGLDYFHHKSDRVEDGHTNVAYWCGRLEEVGLEVIPYDKSTFLNANQRGWIYGYPPDGDPRPPAQAARQRFRILAGIEPLPEEESGG